MSKVLDVLYRHAPASLQNLGVSLFGVAWRWRRYGPGYRRALQQARERERFTAEGWRSYQEAALRGLLAHACEKVPFYRDFALSVPGANEGWASYQLEDLPRLPFLEKQQVRPAPDRLVADGAGRVHAYLTSGTTGTPLTIFMGARARRRWQALYEARCLNWAGVNRHQRRAMIGGRQVVPKGESPPPWWRVNWAEKQLYLSAFHISGETAPHYVKALRDFRPAYLVGYASSWFFLARFVLERRLTPPEVKAVLTSSEKLEPEMREAIQRAFRAPVFDAYSGVEMCCLASECEQHRLHLSPDAGVVELVDPNGKPVPPGEEGEIIATGLINFDQPLIRYRTGDLARLSRQPCPCGRAMPVLEELVGRLEDVVVGRDGREMVRFHGLWVGLPAVVEGQVVQECYDRIRLRVVPTGAFGTHEETILRQRVVDRLGQVEVVIERVEALPRTERGKVKAVVSYVPRPHPCASS